MIFIIFIKIVTFMYVTDKHLCVVPEHKAMQLYNVPSDEYPLTSPGTSSTSVNMSEKQCLKRFVEQENEDPMIAKKPLELPAKSKSQEIVKWKDENAVKVLIKLWHDHEPLFKSNIMKNAEVWRMISESLQKTNSNWRFNAVQCENKFKDLRRHYTTIKDYNAQTGVQPKTCKFYDEMEEVLCMKPSVKPVAIASSLKRRSFAIENCLSPGNASTEVYNSSSNTDENMVVDKKNIKKKTRMERQLETLSSAKQAEAQKREEAREKRHKENMEKKERAITLYENFMTKLLDKL